MSWDEGNFIHGGINSINAVDIRRYHVADTQVKEILQPAPMISFSGDITFNINSERVHSTSSQPTSSTQCSMRMTSPSYLKRIGIKSTL